MKELSVEHLDVILNDYKSSGVTVQEYVDHIELDNYCRVIGIRNLLKEAGHKDIGSSPLSDSNIVSITAYLIDKMHEELVNKLDIKYII